MYAYENGIRFNHTKLTKGNALHEAFIDSHISVNEYDACKHFCECKGIGFVIYVSETQYENFPAEMRALSSPEPKATEPQGEPDFKALAILLIDLYNEKVDIDARIAAVKTKLLQ
jgi:hypothetical protein